MVAQFNPWYLGMAFPFTVPLAVGSYDIPHQPRWRRPNDEDLPYPRTHLLSGIHDCQDKSWLFDHSKVGPACRVQLFDITRGLPQRIEGQFRRHWGFTPALWNLYFRERINLGISLSVRTKTQAGTPKALTDEDAAMAAAALLQKLQHGFFMDRGKRRKINGDFSKLIFAEHLTDLQRKLLADFRFRSQSIPGCQEIRSKVGHLGFWASVVYGNGVFITISPGFDSFCFQRKEHHTRNQ